MPSLLNDNHLERRFGISTGVFIIIASMIGSGVLTSTGYMMQRTPNLWVVLALWLLGGIVALCGAMTMAEMATSYPEVGGDYVYVREAFGARAAFTYGCSMVTLGFAVPVAMIAYTLANFMLPYYVSVSGYLPSIMNISEQAFCILFAAAMILLFTCMHVTGHRQSALAQGFTTIFKVLVLIAFMGLGFFSSKGSWSHFTPPTADISLSAFGANFILVMYAYSGWNGAVYIAGEIKNPGRNLSRTLIIGTVFVTLLYVGLNLLYGFALNPDSLGQLSENELVMYADTANKALFSPGISSVFSALIGLGVIASLSSYIMTGPRIVFAMANDGLLPQILSNACSRTHIPKYAIWTQTFLSLLLLLSGSYGFLLDLSGYGLSAISLMVIFPVFWLRKRSNYKPTFRVPLYPYIPLCFILVNVFMLVAGAIETKIAALLSLSFISVPYFIYPFFRLRKKN